MIWILLYRLQLFLRTEINFIKLRIIVVCTFMYGNVLETLLAVNFIQNSSNVLDIAWVSLSFSIVEIFHNNCHSEINLVQIHPFIFLNLTECSYNVDVGVASVYELWHSHEGKGQWNDRNESRHNTSKQRLHTCRALQIERGNIYAKTV